MAFSSCLCHHQFTLKINPLKITAKDSNNILKNPKYFFALKTVGNKLKSEWSFVGGSRIITRPNLATLNLSRKSSQLRASWLTSPHLASDVFTLGTAAVLPFYTLMVVAPKAKLTRKCMRSSIPYVVLGVVYTYLLYLSWTPDTMRLMFASKCLLPELPGVAKMFSNEMTLASAWIHLLAIDLYAARQVYHDGLENGIETRHSVSLCLLFCPIGILIHAITKTLRSTSRESKPEIH